MKRKIIVFSLLLLFAAVVWAVVPGTIVVGDATYVASRIGAAKAVKLYSVSGYNSSNVVQYIMIFEGTVAPTNAQIPRFSIPVAATNFYSYDFSYYGADLTGVSAANSTTPTNFTQGSTSCSFQFIIGAY